MNNKENHNPNKKPFLKDKVEVRPEQRKVFESKDGSSQMTPEEKGEEKLMREYCKKVGC